MRRVALLLALISALVIGGAAFARETIGIGQRTNGSKVPMHKGARLLVSLPANPSTGYSWKLVSVDRSILKPAGTSYAPHKPVKTGSGGTTTLSYTAIANGTTRLKLAYTQSGSHQVGKRFSVIIAVG